MRLTRASLINIAQDYQRNKARRFSNREKFSLPITRFLRFIRVSETNFYNGTPCWEWLGSKTGAGYGDFCIDGRRGKKFRTTAHQFSHVYFIGAVRRGREIDHLCNNRGCVSPLHLEVVTHSENVRRSYERGRVAYRKKRPTHCPKGHEYTPENTALTKKSLYCKACNKLSCKRSRLKRLGRATELSVDAEHLLLDIM